MSYPGCSTPRCSKGCHDDRSHHPDKGLIARGSALEVLPGFRVDGLLCLGDKRAFIQLAISACLVIMVAEDGIEPPTSGS